MSKGQINRQHRAFNLPLRGQIVTKGDLLVVEPYGSAKLVGMRTLGAFYSLTSSNANNIAVATLFFPNAVFPADIPPFSSRGIRPCTASPAGRMAHSEHTTTPVAGSLTGASH